MNKPVRMAFRNTLAVGITLLATEIYPNPVAVRGLLCASLVSALPTFRRSAMRQRFFLMWMAAGIGMLSEVLFRDAPWFFIPFYFALVCLVFYMGSKSRDTATLIIIAYGLSGSLLNKFPGSGNEPVFDGFFRAFWCSFGLFAGVFSFLVFPIPKAPATARALPVNFSARDCIYLGTCAIVSLIIGVAAAQYLSSPFLVMVTLVWGINLCTIKDKSAMPMTFVFAVLAVMAAVAFDSVISSSTNNLMVFLSAFMVIVWIVNWLRFTFASVTPMLSFFLIVFLAGAGMSPMPFQSFSFTLTNLISVLGGIVVSSVLWGIDQLLRAAELAAEQSWRKKIPC